MSLARYCPVVSIERGGTAFGSMRDGDVVMVSKRSATGRLRSSREEVAALSVNMAIMKPTIGPTSAEPALTPPVTSDAMARPTTKPTVVGDEASRHPADDRSDDAIENARSLID